MHPIKTSLGIVLASALFLPFGAHAAQNDFDIELVAKARSMLYGTSIEAELKRLESKSSVQALVKTGKNTQQVRSFADIPSDGSIRSSVLRYFKDAPEMAAIAECESGMRQYGPSGEVLHGGTGGQMIGLFQLHEAYHRSAARTLGLNIDTLAGNMAYAKHLYNREGAGPWLSSADCWQPKLSLVTTEANSKSDAKKAEINARFSKTLTYGMVHEEVRLLQKSLNAHGFTVADSGPGAPGEETSIFGPLTRTALTKFQCEEKIACSGDSEYGTVGEETRDALNELIEED